MLDTVILILKAEGHPISHSYRGSLHRWIPWIQRIEETRLVRSMSKKGCSPYISVCDDFFGFINDEMFHGVSRTDTSIEEFMRQLD